MKKFKKVKSEEPFGIAVMASVINQNTGLSSASLSVMFVDNATLKVAKLFVRSKNMDGSIISFTGKLHVDEEISDCIGYCYQSPKTEDIWISTIETPTTLSVSVPKSRFVENVKKYYQSENIPYNDDGNIRGEFGIFRQSSYCSTEIIAGALVYPELSNDLFPIMKGDVLEVGEYIEENVVQIYSREEWDLRTAMKIWGNS